MPDYLIMLARTDLYDFDDFDTGSGGFDTIDLITMTL